MKALLFSKSDLKYTLRLLAKNPGFTLLSVLVLAGGLSVGLLAFTFSYTLFFKPIPVPNGERIYHLCAGPELQGCRPMKAFEFAEFRDEISTMENIGIFTQPRLTVEVDEMTLLMEATLTEWTMFPLTGTQALVGRTLQEFDHAPEAEPVMVLGHDVWQLHFNGEDAAVGKIINVDGRPSRIVGVMPKDYLFPWASQIWVPAPQELLNPVQNEPVPVSTFGLLKQDTGADTASAEVSSLMERTRERYPAQVEEGTELCQAGRQLDCDTGHIATLPMGQFGGVLAAVLIVLVGSLIGFIFTLACINVGTLLLARTNARMKDISIRVALGAPRRRLLIQMMGESIIIAVLGTMLGVLLAGMLMEFINILLASFGEGEIAFWQHFQLDFSTLLGALILVVLTVLLTSAYPSWRIINGDFNSVMRDGTRGAMGRRPGRFSRSLVVISIFIITLLVYLTAAIGSYAFEAKQSLQEMSARSLLLARPVLDLERYDAAGRMQAYHSIYQRLQQESAIRNGLILRSRGTQTLESERQNTINGGGFERAGISAVLGDLETNELTLLEGRQLRPADTETNAAVIVVNQSLAQALWPGESAIGKRMRQVSDDAEQIFRWRQVVGVVSSSTSNSLVATNPNTAYIPLTQNDLSNVAVQARALNESSSAIEQATSAISRAILSVAPELRAVAVFDIQEQMRGLNQALNMGLNLAGVIALFAFLIAIAGIFGLTQNFIQSTTQEIGTRRALGANDGLIRKTFLLRGGKQVFLGFVIAMVVAFPFSYLSLITLGAAITKIILPPIVVSLFMLYGAIFLAIYFPIRAILRLEPAESLRYE